MAQQRIVWTVLPYGRIEEGPQAGRLRVSVVASPRLTPEQPDEQVLSAFREWLDWPATLRQVKLVLRVGAQSLPLTPISKGDSALWKRLFTKTTPVAGFVFQNMSEVNLRSYAVRNVLGLLRRNYGALAVQSTGQHPTLLPWKGANPVLKGMLTELGTRTQVITFGDRQLEFPLPGFDRFFDDRNQEGIEGRLRGLVFSRGSQFRAPAAGIGVDEQGNPTTGSDFAVRVLPPDWRNPAGGGPDAALMSQFSSAGEYTLYQASRFYRREPPTDAQLAMRRPNRQNIPAPPKAPDYDFHRIMASFADYPELLRRLGLVIDCALPANSPIDQALQGGPSANGLLWLELVWGNAHLPSDDHCPRTAWHADHARFTTRERTADHERGVLRLQDADDRWHLEKRGLFDVYQVDPDGAALKTVDFLLTAQNLVAKSLTPGAAGEVTYTTGDAQPVAALRSGGLGVSRHGRAAVTAQRAAAAALKDQAVQAGSAATNQIVLFAEDVLRGYRVDVQPAPGGSPGRWHSLCRRHGTYRFIGSADTIDLPDDEGYVKGASTTSTASDTADPDDHYLHESLFRWTGWSLVTPRPGRALRARTDASSGVQNESPEDVTDEATTGGNALAVTFAAAKGSLPRLRFGMPYRFRSRLVDLACNSLSVDDRSLDKDAQVTNLVTYWRFESVDPPALVHRARTSEGESLERMVIRSNWNVDTAAYLLTPKFAAARALPASADFEYTADNERHVVPPKSSQLQCEQHGLFDPLFGDPANIKLAYELAARESGTLYDAGPSTQIELVTPASLTGVATTASVPPKLPTSDNPTGDRLAPGQYVIHREALVDTPYLPDGAAGGFALRAMPGHSLPGVTGPMTLGPSAAVVYTPSQELVLIVTHGQTWPDTKGFRIRLSERKASIDDLPCDEQFPDAGPPQWDEDDRVLTLFLAKGRVVRLRYSSFVHQAFLDTLGIPDWVDSAGARSFVKGMAQVGCAWMITPDRALTMVHATQRPVCQPEFLVLRAERQLGDQHATLVGRLRMHGPSTGKFEVEASWREWVDDVDKPAPELVESHGQLGEVLLAENHVNLFGLAQAVTDQMHDPVNHPRARGDRHEFGDTKFRVIRYTMRATTRFREYLPTALFEQRDEVTRVGPIAEGPATTFGADDDPGAPVVVSETGVGLNTIVKSSTPPDDPRVVYIVPTFRWTETRSTGKLDTIRQGNGLRIWLERPWFSSGDGELLGVVILGDNRPLADVSNENVPFVTQWGLDPLWDTALPKPSTHVADFPARVADETVELRERPGQIVHVVGHRVHWDATRLLWYCDLELDPGRSYMPFVRLAIVRYQPHALDAARISKVVLTDFAQILPRRRAVFTRNGAQVSVSLRGNVPAHGPMQFPLDSEYQDISFIPLPGQATETGRNRVELVLQVRDATLDTDLAWRDAAILGSNLVQPSSMVQLSTHESEAQPVPRAAARRARSPLGQLLHLGPAIDLGVLGIGELFDPTVWQTTVNVPNTGEAPARAVLREFERYYTDRTIPEVRAGATRRRRVVEERLVYTAFFDL